MLFGERMAVAGKIEMEKAFAERVI